MLFRRSLLEGGAIPALSPSATVAAIKNAGNPTANFNCLIENPINVSGTYYAPYITAAQDTIYLASAPSLAGPWTAGPALMTLASVSWKTTQNSLFAPYIYLNPDDGKYDLFYSIAGSPGETYTGFRSATTINGTYSDHGSAILGPGTAGAWDEDGCFEAAVMKTSPAFGSIWVMVFAGNMVDRVHEKIGIATATSVSGPWTKAAGNPIPWGAGGSWNAALQADPSIFEENGYLWIWSLGHEQITPTVTPGAEGLFYNATDPAVVSDWIEHPSNPILVPTPATWDSARCFRGGILVENGVIGGLYTGGTDTSVLTTYKGGNFRLAIS